MWRRKPAWANDRLRAKWVRVYAAMLLKKAQALYEDLAKGTLGVPVNDAEPGLDKEQNC